jgi:signal recognition particle receptor subunit beta
MIEHKIIITGPMGAGKTTAIAALSEIAPIVTDVMNNDRSVDKALTTVGFDYGQLTLDNGDRIRLFGTPGQERFKFMWQTLCSGALGIIILADNSRPDPIADLAIYLDGFADQLKTLPCVVGVGRTETHLQPDLQLYADKLESAGHVFPILPVDVRIASDVSLLVDTLLSQIEADLIP